MFASLTQKERVWWYLANPSAAGFCNINYFLGRSFHLPIRQSHCRKHHLWFQHCMDIYPWLLHAAQWQQFLSIDFSTASYKIFYEAWDICWIPPSGWGLGWRQLDESHGWSHCQPLLCGPRSMKHADTIWLCYISLVPRLRERRDSSSSHMAWVAMGLLAILKSVSCFVAEKIKALQTVTSAIHYSLLHAFWLHPLATLH